MMRSTPVNLTIQVSQTAYKRLSESASAQGYKPSGYARLLFEAAFAARVGQERGTPVDDAELDEQVRLVFALAGQASVAAISKATGVAEGLVEQILDGFLTVTADMPAKARKGKRP